MNEEVDVVLVPRVYQEAARNNMALTMPTNTAVPKTHRPSRPRWVQTFEVLRAPVDLARNEVDEEEAPTASRVA